MSTAAPYDTGPPLGARPEDRAAPASLQDVTTYLQNYMRHRPETAALWCLGLGFLLGWKCKP